MTKADRIRDDGTETKTETAREAKKRNLSPEVIPNDQAAFQGGVGEAVKAGGAAEDDEDPEGLSSFTPKSPISEPYIPDELADPAAHPEIFAAYEHAQAKYRAKLGRRYTLTHKRNLPSSCLIIHPHLHPVRESAQKAVLRAAKSIIRLSSSVDGDPLANCCGLWIRWDEESKTGVVLTSAHVIRSNSRTENQWDGRDEYNIQAKVIVHLLDNTTAEGHLLYHQEHYDLAFFKVRVDEEVQLPSFNGSVHCGQDVFQLGRDDNMNLRITHGRVEYWNSGCNERHHYMYLSHEKNEHLSHQRNDRHISLRDDDDMCDDDGGPVIDLDGNIVGLVNNGINKSFVPSSILDRCLDLWWKFRHIPRLHLGMKYSSVRLLDPINVDKLWRMYKIEDGLIVEEVSKESHAERLGICLGDIIERFNGECVSTTVELENMLLSRCTYHFDQGIHLNAKTDVSIQVFHTEERLRRTVNLTVDVSDGGEVISRRTYPITAIEGTSATVQSSQNVTDDSLLARPALTWEALGCMYSKGLKNLAGS